MTTIHAELSADGQRLVLIAGGGPDPGYGGPAGHDGVIGAAKQLKLLTPLFSKSDPPGALTVPATWPAVVQLAATFGPAWAPGSRLRAWTAERLAERAYPAAQTYEPPAGLVPYTWQVAGAGMIAATGRALITDEPGTGKTITAILGLVERAQRQPRGDARAAVGSALVVCPASVVDPWVEAWRTWAPHVRAVAWRGPKRRELAGTAEVYVTSYETARIDAPPSGARGGQPLLKLEVTHLVIDECHLIKNHDAARSKAVRRIAHKVPLEGSVVALSGTPITHHPGDLWPALDAMSHDAWPSSERWVQRYCQIVPGDYREENLGLLPATEPEFRNTLLGQHRRVAKADVLTQLPPKVYSVRTVELPEKWRAVYDEFEAQMLAELPDGSELQVMDTLSVLSHLSSLSNAAADVRIDYGPDVNDHTGEPKRHVHLDAKAPSWKVDALLELLSERYVEPGGSPVVAFAPSRQLVELAGREAELYGYRVGYVVGGQAAGQRTANVEAFQRGELDLICVTTGAGGVGLTLTAARTCVFLQRPWSLVEAVQAEDRCHRIGSERHDSIEVIDIVARNTIDSRVRAVLRERAGQLADLVQDRRIVTDLLGGSGVQNASPRHSPSAASTTPVELEAVAS